MTIKPGFVATAMTERIDLQDFDHHPRSGLRGGSLPRSTEDASSD